MQARVRTYKILLLQTPVCRRHLGGKCNSVGVDVARGTSTDKRDVLGQTIAQRGRAIVSLERARPCSVGMRCAGRWWWT